MDVRADGDLLIISVPSRKTNATLQSCTGWFSLFSFRIFLAFLAAGLFNDTVIVTFYCSVSALCLSGGSSLDLSDRPHHPIHPLAGDAP